MGMFNLNVSADSHYYLVENLLAACLNKLIAGFSKPQQYFKVTFCSAIKISTLNLALKASNYPKALEKLAVYLLVL